MTYILTVWLLVSGQWLPGTAELPSAEACKQTVAQTTADLVVWNCVLEIEV